MSQGEWYNNSFLLQIDRKLPIARFSLFGFDQSQNHLPNSD